IAPIVLWACRRAYSSSVQTLQTRSAAAISPFHDGSSADYRPKVDQSTDSSLLTAKRPRFERHFIEYSCNCDRFGGRRPRWRHRHMPFTYATAFAAHDARGSTLRPRDTIVRPGDTMVHRATTLGPRLTMVRAGDTTIKLVTTRPDSQCVVASPGP